jgi:hypothetical protein
MSLVVDRKILIARAVWEQHVDGLLRRSILRSVHEIESTKESG